MHIAYMHSVATSTFRVPSPCFLGVVIASVRYALTHIQPRHLGSIVINFENLQTSSIVADMFGSFDCLPFTVLIAKVYFYGNERKRNNIFNR